MRRRKNAQYISIFNQQFDKLFYATKPIFYLKGTERKLSYSCTAGETFRIIANILQQNNDKPTAGNYL